MSSFCICKSYSLLFSKNIRVYAIFNDQSFNDTLTNNIISLNNWALTKLPPNGSVSLSPSLKLFAFLYFLFVFPQALTEMTGCYSFVQKMPKAPEPLAERLGQDRQNNTPPSPELLSQRLSKLAKEKGDNSNVPIQKKTMYGDMPPPPKLLGKYSFMSQKPS